MIRPPDRSSRHLMPILIASIILLGDVLAPAVLPSPRSIHATGVESPPCKLTIQNTDPSLQDIARRYQIAFQAVCPLLVKRFALKPDVANDIIVTFSSKVPLDIEAKDPVGNRIEVSSAFLREHPYEAVGLFIACLSYVIQNYRSADVSAKFSWAMSYYVRSIYGPKDDDWALPSSILPEDTYESYTAGARFLHWLQQRTVPTFVDQLNRAIQAKQSFPSAFQRLTGGTVDQLWGKYKADPALRPFQRFPTPDGNIARKSLSCKLTIQTNDSSLQTFARSYQRAFKAACPILVKRFARRADIANNVTLIFSSKAFLGEDPTIKGRQMGNSITLKPEWVREDPKQGITIGLLHELTHVIQNYPLGEPEWFREGMAHYVAEVYRPADSPSTLYDYEDPEMRTDLPGKHYTRGYGVAARFLIWLEQHTTPTLVDQLHRAIQSGQFFSEAFKRLTGGTEDELWDEYKANHELAAFQHFPILDT